MRTGMLIQDSNGRFVPLHRDVIPRWVGGRGYQYNSEYYAESEPIERYTEHEVYELRKQGRVRADTSEQSAAVTSFLTSTPNHTLACGSASE